MKVTTERARKRIEQIEHKMSKSLSLWVSVSVSVYSILSWPLTGYMVDLKTVGSILDEVTTVKALK